MFKVLYLITLAITVIAIDNGYDYSSLKDFGNEVGLTCDECKKMFDTIKVFGRTETGHDIIENIAESICEKKDGFGHCKQFCDDLCDGIVKEYAPIVWSVIDSTGSDHFCKFLQFCPYNNTEDSEVQSIKFSFTAPLLIKIPCLSEPLQRLKVKKINDLPNYFLQLTDLHIDSQYHEDTATNCGLPQCCRLKYNKTVEGQPNEMSQKFGSVNCDTPNATWMSLLDEVKNVNNDVNFSFILITGDIPPHDVWNQSHIGNLETIRNVLNDLENVFPNTPIYYIFGNHDNYPINLCTTNQTVKTSYNALDYFTNISKLGWFKWLSDDAKESFLTTGQYRTLVNGTDLLLIALNSNLFAGGNLWLSMEDNYQIGNLSLYLEESFNQFPNNSIYVINHIPFYSNEFLPNVKDAYNLIANQNRIKGIFEGHQHSDNFHLMYDYNGSPSQVAYIPPALVAGETNPSFRYYSADPKSWEVLDYFQYRMDLTKSNENGQVDWYLAYQAKDRLGLADLSARSWFDFVGTLGDEETYENYLNEVFHGGLLIPENKKEIICSLLTDRIDLTRLCLNSSFFQ